MSLFDFPRIHLSGNIDIDVPTINNAVYFPLTMYDQVRSQPLFPPRLYFSTADIINKVSPSINPIIHQDEYNGYVYLEIESINTIPLLRIWCMTPLGGADSPDKAYIPYYQAAQKDLGAGGFDLIGSAPGYWNMWGSMSVTMSNVNVTGVQTFDGNSINTYAPNDTTAPSDVQPFLQSSFNLNVQPTGTQSSACMVETVSAQSCYANIYCSSINLYNTNNPSDVFLQGDPNRFAALIYSSWRVVNWMPPMAGSGRFCGTIAFADSTDTETSQLVDFFKNNNGYDGRTIQGIFISFQILEVFEDRYDQSKYKNNQFNPTTHYPALGSTIVSITPWYEDDMETGIIGRNLIAASANNSWFINKIPGGPTIRISPTPPIASCKVLGNGKALFSLDMGNTWPESMSPQYTIPDSQPTNRDLVSFETMDVGTISLRYGNVKSAEICNIKINPTDYPLSQVKQIGCVFDWVIEDPTMIENIQNNYIQVYQELPLILTDKLILQESLYMFSSDQKGIYSNVGDTANLGYYASSGTRVPCRLRIYEKGIPVLKPITVYMGQYSVPEAGNDSSSAPNNVLKLSLKDNDIVNLTANPTDPLNTANNAIYYFAYDQQYPGNQFPIFVNNNNYTIMDTGAFVVLRAHPTKDYSKYIDKTLPGYKAPTWEIMYHEIFQLYDVVYPVMANIIPFTEANWNNGTTAGMVLQRTQMSNFTSIMYMPRSREMSAAQLQLIQAWADTFNNPQN